MTARRDLLCGLAGLLALAGCSAVPERPTRAMQYDFGPAPGAASSSSPANPPPIALGEVDASSALDGTALLYRLGYANPNQLQPYAQARWSATIPQLIRQRLRERLAQDRVVLDLTEAGTLARARAAMPRILRLQLEEFAQWFDAPASSVGVLRLRATLTDNTPAGERVLAQRAVVARQPAPTPDAAGAVKALASAVDAAADDIARWLVQQP